MNVDAEWRLNHYKPIIDAWQGLTAYVVGDAMYDLYRFGRVERLCPEGPVPVLIPERYENRHGGAANVTANLRALGLETRTTYGTPMSTKTRFMVGSHLLLREDRDEVGEIKVSLDYVKESVKAARVLVLSDYLKGALTPQWCGLLIGAAREIHIPVVVDPKGKNWDKYTGALAICPNTSELFATSGNQTNPVFPVIFEKQGAKGITVYTDDPVEGIKHRRHAALARHVFDVTGAGDTVVATIAAALAVSADFDDAADLANAAASVVVAEVGTSVCTKDQLLARIAEG